MMQESERDLLIRMDEKMDAVLQWQEEHRTGHIDQEKRLRGVEAWKYKEAGALGVLTVLFNVVVDWVTGRPR